MRIVHSYGDITFNCKDPQFFTYIRHSWPLISAGTLAFHGSPFTMVISEDLWHSHLLASVTLAVELSQPVLRNPDLQNQDFLGLELDPSVT